ncbi:PREDICTED: uncharacterized protein LOC106099840, partial [Papilio polytes]|uniref:uncharacterized protein LOC106099840 n=1 Tax=Papilio polytes TaxID=76194 RepID=UPI0006766102
LPVIQLALAIKTNSRPVYEVINEQTKSDERLIKTSAVANLPYGNPLAGNSQQNAKLHAHNQQAMFNAERIRQHKAQLQQQQKWLKTPRVHNYMLTQESQENHQLAIERAQAELNDDLDSMKTKENDVLKEKHERRRKHRSYGTENTYVINEQIKPNTINEMAETSNRYQENPSQRYPVQDIETLNSLLNKNPNQQLTEFNALINNPKININHDKELERPIDLYFHIKGTTKNPLPEHTRYAQIPIIQETYKYIPMKENESDDPNLQQRNMELETKKLQYNTELNHIFNAIYNPLHQEYKIKEHKALNYVPEFNQNTDITDLQRYLQRNKGVHFNKDGGEIFDNFNYASSYEFGYRVHDMHSGNNFGHQEEKKGEETNGQYHVLLPDGRMQNVIYSAGPEGFHADITYDGRK